ncbi:hypothetical protein Rhe02_26700 [Rhizocola hellebori]|uniref:Uncharacterized protein n=1 Tax=Rhizocola hellebori TaxID=1392758 RepID=A0A8J3VG84_9ACTN|nr:DUF6232 family protein [Rhizocola hellebori]GIH04603.1 hypothetical protein Rhe02_26700 [Rhizocola hellebori]
MLTYYRDRTVEVTSVAVHIHGRVYALSELEYVWHLEVQADPSVRRRAASRGALNIGVVVAVILALLGIVFLVTATLTNPGTAAAVLVPLAVVVLLVAMAGPMLEWVLHRFDRSYDVGSKVHEIWCVRHGKELLLIRVADETRFGKIYRSIQRALENHP